MSGERMEDLHRELDAAIERVRAGFGKSYPMMIGGRAVRAASEFDDRSPIDTRILLGRFQSGGREHVRDAVAAAKAAFPGVERAALARARGAAEESWRTASARAAGSSPR